MKKKFPKITLNNSPSFVYHQLPQDDESMPETPIEVVFYQGGVDIKQEGEGVYISDEHLKNLFKEILEKRGEANNYLK